MERMNWITTEQMLEVLMNAPDQEFEFDLRLCGGFLSSTHWVIYDAKRRKIGHTRDIKYAWFTEAEFLEAYAGCKWRRFG